MCLRWDQLKGLKPSRLSGTFSLVPGFILLSILSRHPKILLLPFPHSSPLFGPDSFITHKRDTSIVKQFNISGHHNSPPWWNSSRWWCLIVLKTGALRSDKTENSTGFTSWGLGNNKCWNKAGCSRPWSSLLTRAFSFTLVIFLISWYIMQFFYVIKIYGFFTTLSQCLAVSDFTKSQQYLKPLMGHRVCWCLWRKGQIKEVCFQTFF